MRVLEQRYSLEQMKLWQLAMELVIFYLILNDAENPEIHDSILAAFTVEARWRGDLFWSTGASFLRNDKLF